jgi:hypothetical protein
MSTKNVLDRPWVEFVLGIEQVVKGFDRGLALMSVGERSKIIVSPEYGCMILLISFFLFFFNLKY